MPEITVPLDWRPRDYQLPAWEALEDGMNRACLVWHRRAGKDLFSINWCSTQVFQRVGLYWHVLPTYRQGRKVVWEGRTRTGRSFLSHFPEETIVRRRDDEMTLWFMNGSQYQVIGADEPDRLVGANPVGVIFSEWSLMNPASWDFIRPILVENGGWAVFIYTPRGRNHGWKTLDMALGNKKWFAQVLKADETSAVTQEAIQDEREAGMPEELIQQEFYCSFDAAMVGSYYGPLMTLAMDEGRISNVPYDPKLPVTTSWDLGIGDATAIWFSQRVGKEIRMIDYYQSSGVGLDHYAKMLHEKPYSYVDHLVPWDAAVRELGTGMSRLEVAKSHGVRMRITRKLSLDDGIQGVRTLIPQMWFDKTKCEKGIEALRQYQKSKSDERGPDGEMQFKDRPKHDWTSHAADALRTLAVGMRPERPAEQDGVLAPKVAIV